MLLIDLVELGLVELALDCLIASELTEETLL